MNTDVARFQAAPHLRLLAALVFACSCSAPAIAEESVEEEIVEEEPAAPSPAATPAKPAPVQPDPAVEPAAESPAEEPEGTRPAQGETAEASPAEGDEGLEVADEAAPTEEPAVVASPAPTAVPEPADAPAPVAPVAAEQVEEPVVKEEVVADDAAESAMVEPVIDIAPIAAPVISPEPPPMPVWNPRAQEAAFTDFLRAGIPLDPAVVPTFAGRLLEPAESHRSSSMQNEQVFITGTHAPGTVFAVYRASPGAPVARFMGLISTLQTAGPGRTRATVMRSTDLLMEGDSLVALTEARAEFDRERARAVRGNVAGETAGHVVNLNDERLVQSQPDELLLVDRGSRDGVTLAWMCELPREGSRHVSAWGRVVRTSERASLIRVVKTYEPVRPGVSARLASRPVNDRARVARGR